MVIRISILLLLLSGCGKTEDTTTEDDTGRAPDLGPCSSGPIGVEIGTGENQFEPLAAGDDIEVIHGAQDGHHIVASVRLHNTPDIATIHYWIEDPVGETVVSDQVYRTQMTAVSDGQPCSFESVGMFGYLGRIEPDTATFLDSDVVVHMDIEGSAGRRSSDSVRVIPYLIPVERDPVR